MLHSRELGVLTSFALLASSAALANDGKIDGSGVPVQAKDPDEEILVEGRAEEDPEICRRVKPPTASRISRSKKICKPQSEWVAQQRRSRQNTDDIMRDEMKSSQRNTSDAFNNMRGGPSPR